MSRNKIEVIKRKLRLVLTGTINTLIFKLLYPKGFSSTDTIVICGSIRSGSTWLAEILSSLEGHVQLFEPLHQGYVKEVNHITKEKNPYMPVGASWPEGQAFFERVLSGRLINPWIMSQIPFSKLFGVKRLVVKFVRANLLLSWMTRHLNMRMPILVIRHPCGVITSHLKKQWPPGKDILLGNSYFDGHPDLKEKCQHLSKPEELAALAWCLRYHAPLFSERPQDYLLVSYEALVRNGAEELKRIYDAWGLPVDQAAVQQLTQPSDTSTSESMVVKGKDPLAGWKLHLTEQQVQNILKVLAIFNLDFYSQDLEPDYTRLRQFGWQSSHD